MPIKSKKIMLKGLKIDSSFVSSAIFKSCSVDSYSVGVKSACVYLPKLSIILKNPENKLNKNVDPIETLMFIAKQSQKQIDMPNINLYGLDVKNGLDTLAAIGFYSEKEYNDLMLKYEQDFDYIFTFLKEQINLGLYFETNVNPCESLKVSTLVLKDRPEFNNNNHNRIMEYLNINPYFNSNLKGLNLPFLK